MKYFFWIVTFEINVFEINFKFEIIVTLVYVKIELCVEDDLTRS